MPAVIAYVFPIFFIFKNRRFLNISVHMTQISDILLYIVC